MDLTNHLWKMGNPPTLSTILRVHPPALLAHAYVPPVEAGSAYAPQALAAPGDIVDVADDNPSPSSSARRFLAINDRLDDKSVDHDAAFGSPSVSREAARFLEEDADEMHPMDDDAEPLSEPMHEDEENAPAPPLSKQTSMMTKFWYLSLSTVNRYLWTLWSSVRRVSGLNSSQVQIYLRLQLTSNYTAITAVPPTPRP